jgi:hypothetical protein
VKRVVALVCQCELVMWMMGTKAVKRCGSAGKGQDNMCLVES